MASEAKKTAKLKKFPTKYAGVRYFEHKRRKHGSRPDRYFSVYYTLPDGKRREEGAGWASEGMTPEKASAIRGGLMEARRTGHGATSLKEKRELKAREEAQAKSENVTFIEAAEHYLERTTKKSKRHDETRLRLHVLPVLGEKRLRDILVSNIEDMRTSVENKGKAQATVNHCLQLVRRVFNHAFLHDLFDGQNPMKKVKIKKPDNGRVAFLTYEQADTLLSALEERSQDMHDQTLVSLMAGLRFGEIVALTWSDVDLEARLLHVLDAKAGSRTAYINDRLLDMFNRRMLDRDVGTHLVFPGRFGDQINKVGRTFDRVVEDLGWNKGVRDRRKRITFHTMRHSFASWLAIAGTPLLTLKELMGHRSVEMTMRYAHLIPDMKRDAIQKIGQNLAAKVLMFPSKKAG